MRRTILCFSVFALVLASCGGGSEGGKASGSTAPGASASVATATASPTPSPTPGLRTDYDIPSWSEIVAMYDYDASQPLDDEIVSEEQQQRATVYEITYQSADHPVPARLVIPKGAGPFPAVLFAAHYEGDPWYYVPDAVALARDGFAGLVIESPALREPYVSFDYPNLEPEDNIDAYVTAVIEARRGIDLLETLPEIDATRIGFLGGGSGANTGTVLAGVDPRIDAYVWMCGDPYYTEIARLLEEVYDRGLAGDSLSRWQERVAVLNPQVYVEHARRAHSLLQVWRDSPFCDVGLQEFFKTIPEPRTLEWYPDEQCGPGGCDPGVRMAVDHRAWLQENV